jgi:hypothetical protein
MSHAADTHRDGARERSVAEVEAELAAARNRLAGTVDDLAEAVSPQELARRQGEKVKDFFVGPEGVRVDRVAKVAGAVLSLAMLRSLVRRRS